MIDNLDNPLLFTQQARDRVLPSGDHIHVIVTTLLDLDCLPGIPGVLVGPLTAEDSLALLASFRPMAGPPDGDDWNAGRQIVRQLGGHTLAIELAGVLLGEFPQLSHGELLARLESGGTLDLDVPAGTELPAAMCKRIEDHIAAILEPILLSLSSAELSALEYAAFLPPDRLPLPWLNDLITGDFAGLTIAPALPEREAATEPSGVRVGGLPPGAGRCFSQAFRHSNISHGSG